MNEMTGNDAQPAGAVMMGELAALVSIVENMLLSHEVAATDRANGVLWPSRTALYSAMAMQSEFNARMLEIIRELAGARHDHAAVVGRRTSTIPQIARRHRALHALRLDRARERVALMRLAWDFIGSEFGSRHQQYEKFYGGASFLVKQNVNRFYDFPRATGLVERALKLPALQS